jgi:hypothetical protein
MTGNFSCRLMDNLERTPNTPEVDLRGGEGALPLCNSTRP